MDPYTAYQLLYGAGAASLAGGAGAAAYGTYRAAKGAYNLVGRMRSKRPAPSGSFGSRYKLSRCRKTRAYKRSPVQQKSVSAPASRVIDTKYVDLVTTFSGVKSTAATGGLVGAIAGGTGEGQRVGNDIRIIRYLVTMRLKHGSESTDQWFRLLMVRSKTGNSDTNPALTDILNNDSNSNTTPMSLRNVNNLEDWEILLDKTIKLTNHTGALNHSVALQQFQIDTCFPQRFSGTGSSSIIRNPVFWYLVTDAPNTTTGALGQITFRIMYSDI